MTVKEKVVDILKNTEFTEDDSCNYKTLEEKQFQLLKDFFKSVSNAEIWLVDCSSDSFDAEFDYYAYAFIDENGTLNTGSFTSCCL